MDTERIRNFCIIAHVDHGKSTLADRLLELTGTVPKNKMKEQVLDAMDIERERGITIKSHPISMDYTALDGNTYLLNLIDTPGHVDFSYEVSRALAACEGAILVVDASQGIEAQTVSHLYLALENGLHLVPVINKIDMPSARVDEVAAEVAHLIGIEPERVLRVSAKEGTGVEQILERIVEDVPPPSGSPDAPLRALIFDSKFDQFRGAVAYVRVVQGRIAAGQRIQLCSTRKESLVDEVGTFGLRMIPGESLEAGKVGYVIANVRDVSEEKVGDTMVPAGESDAEPLPGYRPMKPMVFAGLYPLDTDEYIPLKEALAKLALNDSSLVFEPDTSVALGFGFRCGFLGPLHMEIVQERIRREYGLELIATVPSVGYRVRLRLGETIDVTNPSRMPPVGDIDAVSEPYVTATIVLPSDYVGPIMKLLQERRGIHKELQYLEETRARLVALLPLSEILVDFHDRLKSSSRGYASLDYEFEGYHDSELVKVDVLLNGDPVDALSIIVHESKSFDWGRRITERLKELIPKQMFPVAIQAAVGSRVLSRSTVGALKKNVTAKCYGGDITRKRKLWAKQKEGKRRMKQLGSVQVPQEAFLALLRLETSS
jgi:GTP-binding protein LepA